MAVPKRVALNEVAVIERDIVDPTAIESGTLYVGLENIESGGRFVGVRPVDAGELASSKFAFTPQHLLYGKLRPYLAKIARPNFEGICSTDILPVLPGSDLDRGYLAWLLLTPEMIALASSRATGANLPRLSPNALAELRIPLPPLLEQRRIAEILDKADALRAKRRAALAQLDTLTQSIFLDMFGDPATNPKGWPVLRIDEITECLDRLRRPVTESDRRPGDVPYYGANGQQGWIDTPLFNESLVLVAEDGGYFDEPERGVAYRIDGPSWVNNHAHILRARPEVVNIEFLHRALHHYNFLPFISGTTRAKLTQGQLNSVKLAVPTLELQKQFDERVGAVLGVVASAKVAKEQLDALFLALQHRAFGGDLLTQGSRQHTT